MSVLVYVTQYYFNSHEKQRESGNNKLLHLLIINTLESFLLFLKGKVQNYSLLTQKKADIFICAQICEQILGIPHLQAVG